MRHVFAAAAAAIALAGWCGGASAETHTISAGFFDYASERDIEIEAEISTPGTDSWPVAFVLHGCDGVTQWSRPVLERHARFYAERGYATVILDSWSPRRIRDLCNPRSEEQMVQADPANRVADIEAVTAELAKMDGFNGEILVDGLSHGGWAALSVLTSQGDEPLQARLTAIVAWYPPCAAIDPLEQIPTLVFAGAEDRHPATPPQACVEAAKRYDWVETLLLDGATHGFDYPYSFRSAGAAGRMSYSSEATEKAYERLGAWLNEQGLP